MTFLGPSGSGKTTTLNLIAGFLTPSEGRILMEGNAIEQVPPHRRNIGMVFQNYALFPHMTAYENVAFPLKRRNVKGAELKQRVTDALELVQLVAHRDQYPRQLSGGQQQRVAFARAVVFNPRLLLMDEPLGALDRRLREALQLEIKRLHQRLGITFLYVTHDQEEALVLSQRIVVFNGGRIQQIGNPTELYERPANVFVAEFLGDSTQFRGTVSGAGEYVDVVDGSRTLRVRNAHQLPSGSRGAIVVRPEWVSLRATGGGEPPTTGDDRNRLLARVESVAYFGSGQRVEVDVEGGGKGLAMIPAGRHTCPEPGDAVELSWALDDAVLLDGEEGPSDSKPDAEADASLVAHATSARVGEGA